MKIRIQGNSIRYRLRKPEVEHLKHGRAVIEAIRLGPHEEAQLRFVLEVTAGSEIVVRYREHTTTVCIPKPLAEEWTETEMVGFDAIIDTGDGNTLKVLVEKDFACLDGSEEENAGAYPNPATQC